MRNSENQLIYEVQWHPRMVYKTTLPPISLDDSPLVEPTSWYPKPSIIGSYVPPTVTSDNAPYGYSAEAKIVYIHLPWGLHVVSVILPLLGLGFSMDRPRYSLGFYLGADGTYKQAFGIDSVERTGPQRHMHQ